MGLGVLVDQLEGEELDVGLDGLVGELAPNKTLGIEDGVLGVGGQLILGSISNKPEKFIVNLNSVSGRCCPPPVPPPQSNLMDGLFIVRFIFGSHATRW